MKFKLTPEKFFCIFISIAVFSISLGWSEILPANSLLQNFIGLTFPDLRNGYQYISHMIPTSSGKSLFEIKNMLPSFIWELISFIIAFRFFLNNRSLLNSMLLFLLCFLMGQSAGGRRVGFDALGYVVLCYLLCLLFIKINLKKKYLDLSKDNVGLFLWHGSLTGVCILYSSSGISKLIYSGFSWVSDTKIALFLKFQNYYFEAGYLPFDLSPLFPAFLHKPHFTSTILSSATLAIETLAIFFPLFGKTYPLLLFSLVLVQCGLGAVTGIWLPHIIIPIFILTLIGFWFYRDLKLSFNSRLSAFLIGLLVLIITWAMPREHQSDRRYMYPFATFSMFSNHTDSFTGFEIINLDGLSVDINTIVPSSKTNTFMLNFPLDGSRLRANTVLCSIFLLPDSKFFDDSQAYRVIEFNYSFNKLQTLEKKVIPLELNRQFCEKQIKATPRSFL